MKFGVERTLERAIKAYKDRKAQGLSKMNHPARAGILTSQADQPECDVEDREGGA